MTNTEPNVRIRVRPDLALSPNVLEILLDAALNDPATGRAAYDAVRAFNGRPPRPDQPRDDEDAELYATALEYLRTRLRSTTP